MRRLLGVGVILLLAVGFSPGSLFAQQAGSTGPPGQRGDHGFRLEQNYPNPFNPTTKIPFDLYPEFFANGRPAVVSIRIYNVLQQFVAYPVALDYPAGRVAVDHLKYTAPGHYEAYWDGFDKDHRKVASGVYYVVATVNGATRTMKILVGK